MQSSVAVTVSSPAIRKRKQMSRMSSRVRRSPSTSALEEVRQEVVLAAPSRARPAPCRSSRRPSRRSSAGSRLGLRGPLRRPGHVLGPDDAVLHGEEACPARPCGRPSSVRKTSEGNGTENSLAKSTSPRSMNPSMRWLTRSATSCVHGRHLAGGEDRVEQLAELLVLRRVDLERDHRPLVLQVDGVHVGREDLGVTQGEVDVLLARQEDARARAACPWTAPAFRRAAS